MRYLLPLALLALVATPALAQSPSAEAAYETVTLAEGFTPDPYDISLTAGGGTEVDVPGCGYGYVADAPDAKLYYETSGGSDLYIYAVGDGDTTILVNLPDTSWDCDDDGYSVDGDGDPMLVIPNASSGRYDIWVGTYGEDTVQATLHISEINPTEGWDGMDEGMDMDEGYDRTGGAPDPSADATYDTASLTEGFEPDPYTVSLTAGGSVAVDVDGCSYGNVANAPDAKLYYDTTGSSDLYIYAVSSEDTTILVNLPDSSWACDDDSYGDGDPILVIPGGTSGRYDIWVGTFGADLVEATLFISEIDPR